MAFSYYKAVTIQTGQVPSPQSSFPVLLPFLAGDADFAVVASGGKAQNSSGFDIRPYADSGLTTPLTFELATNSYNSATGAFEMWVNVTAQDAKVVYVAVGDPTISTDGSSTATWNSSFIGAYHLGNGSSLSLTDSSTAGNNLTNNNVVTAAAGQVGGAASFVRTSSQYLAKTGVTQPSAITISGWVKATSFTGAYNAAFVSGNAGATAYVLGLLTSAGKVAEYVHPGVTDVSFDPGTHTQSTATWYHIALSYDSVAGLVGYVNAVSDGTGAANGVIASGTVEITLGRDPADATRYWNGLLDEVHFSNVARSANWITTEYNNQSNLATFWSKGSLLSADAQQPEAFACIGPTSPRMRLGPKIALPLSQTTHVQAPFTIDMVAGSVPSRFRARLGPRIPLPISQTTHTPAPFSVEMAPGCLPYPAKPKLGPKIPLPTSETTQVDAPFSVEMSQGNTPFPSHAHLGPKIPLPFSQTTHIDAPFSQEMIAGNSPFPSHAKLGPRIPLPVSQTTQVNAPFSPEMVQGNVPSVNRNTYGNQNFINILTLETIAPPAVATIDTETYFIGISAFETGFSHNLGAGSTFSF